MTPKKAEDANGVPLSVGDWVKDAYDNFGVRRISYIYGNAISLQGRTKNDVGSASGWNVIKVGEPAGRHAAKKMVVHAGRLA